MRRREHPLLRESVWDAGLDGGAHVCVVPRPGHRCHAVLRIDFGALHETSASGPVLPEGTAHFLEHRLFETPTGDIAQRFSDLGADVDAQTGLSSTEFSCAVGPQETLPAIGLLFEMTGQGCFTGASVARERAIIGHEIELFEDSLEWVAFQTALAALYSGQRLAVDIAGTPQSLGRIDAEVLRAGHQAGYRPSAVQLTVSGPVDPRAVVDAADAGLGRWPAPEGVGAEPPAAAWPRPRVLHARLPVPRSRHLLVFPDHPTRHGLELLRREVACELALDVLFGGSSAFFARHYESGLVDGETFGGEVHLDPAFGFCLVGGDTPDPAALEAAILAQLEVSSARDHIAAGLERARRCAYGDLVCRWEDPESCTAVVESAMAQGCHPFDLVALYTGEERVTDDEVHDVLQGCLRPGGYAVATVQDPAGPTAREVA